MDNTFKDCYHSMIESLKRYQRAELITEKDENLIESLYTDPYEGSAILKSMLNDQMTLLIGRKGSGKSTIINRFQHEIRKSKDKISLYIDVRTLYSKSSGGGGDIEIDNAFSADEQTRFSIYSNFIKRIIEEIKNEINKNLFDNSRWKPKFLSNKMPERQFATQLDAILNASLNQYADISKYKTQQEKNKLSVEDTIGVSTGAKLSTNPEIGASTTLQETKQKSKEQEYSVVLKREFQIVNFADELKKLLASIGLKKVFICLDDCSELDKDALDIFVKTIVAPLHNDSEGFYRFKIAFYPERYSLPDIDRTKIDTQLLDYYHLYKSTGADKVEEQAISYVRRLLQQRIKCFFNTEDVSGIENQMFDTRNLKIDDYYKLLFQICSCIPRNIGKVLFYAQRRSISQGKPITKVILQESAEEQYQNDVEPTITREEFFTYKSYGEFFRRTQLKALMQKIVEKAKENKKRIGESKAEIYKNYSTANAPSHFLFVKKGENENYLSTLEINFFVTRISEQKDKGDIINKQLISNDIVVYTINYGLCQKENIVFDDVSNRKYRIERVFDFNKLIEEWANSSAYVKCQNCGAEYDISEWETIKDYDCFCKECKRQNSCVLERQQINTSANNQPNSTNTIFSQNNDLKNEQLRIIHCLYVESGLTAASIASELDCSTETINAYLRNDRKLRTEGYVVRNEENRTYSITDKSKETLYNNALN